MTLKEVLQTVLALAQIQSEVLAAVYNVRAPIPTYVEAGFDEDRRQTRFNIYRNNFYVAVITVLKERFPVTERIVGEDFFKATAREFVERAPPLGQSNLGYGQKFPRFLDTFPQVADLPYLADVARLEWARFEAAISADQPTVSARDFREIDPMHAARVTLHLHPSLRTLEFDHPVYDIWRTNHEDDEVRSLVDVSGGQAVMVSRSPLGIEVHQIPSAAIALIDALKAGHPLGDAYERAGDQLSQHDFSKTLALLLSSGAVSSLHVPEFAELNAAQNEIEHT